MDVSNKSALSSLLDTSLKLKAYAGFDPTAKSLHIGNLLSILALLHFIRDGHSAIALIGGATAQIGDPSGRSTERVALETNIVSSNATNIKCQLECIFTNAFDHLRRRQTNTSAKLGEIVLRDNLDWFKGLGMLQFLREVGRARVSTMLAKDSVKSRLESPEGISFTEFTYQLLQAYDFWYLWKHERCQLQIGGSDQWGNIVAESKKEVEESEAGSLAFGITIPLLTTATGEKFGKSAGNALWLDP
ncbi:tyrosyl-tRNA synthetase, partial [Nowakowskiella sp. JEL0078]